MDDGEREDSANSFVASVSFLPVYHRMQPPGFQGGAEIKKVAWRLFFFTPGGGGAKTQGRGQQGWQLFKKHKIQILIFIWALCSLGIFLICLYVS